MGNSKLKILLVSVAIIAIIPLLLTFPLGATTNSNSAEIPNSNQDHDDHVLFPTASADELVDVEHHFKKKDLAGDAEKNDGLFVITDTYVDDLNHCEFCTRIQYYPGEKDQAGFSYLSSQGYDLTNAKRVTFYAMGLAGDAKVQFFVAGKDAKGKGGDDLFKTQKFAKATKAIKLENDWRKIEIDVSNLDLKDITHPFGFKIKPSKDSGQIVFYLKSVFFDTQPAENPIETEKK
jgi:hypothetical protein